MLRVGIIGFGGMGQVHFDRYRRLVTEGYPIKLGRVDGIDVYG
jgi:predicted dehydrogenase